ncbi:MAG: hypothetical protein KY468_08595, partial [Armatimonadetes bacterium]|nr:hypothetical protein [Armatimonadota bacterium]
MSKTSFLLKTGLLLGSYALSSMFYPMPLFAQQVYTQGRGQIRAKIIVDKAPNSDTPEYVSATSTLIVRARVAVKAPARSVRGPKVLRRRTPGGYAWHDFLFDQDRV